ncbi:MAG TPA: MFS transporter, partial [Myxococcota bacterium]|nr:MFS transporter [Myxococcota bacterium]
MLPPTLRDQPLPAAYWYLWAGMLINRLGHFVVPFLALYLTEERHLPVAQVGLVVSLYGAGGLLAAPLGGVCADRFGRRGTTLLGMALSAVSLLVLGATSALPAVAIATFSLGFLGDLARPAVYATVADVVPPAARARAYGLLSWAINLGFAVSPVVAGVASARSFALLFWADAATTLACAGIIWRFVPESRPAAQSPPTWEGYLAPYRDRIFVPFVGLIFMTTLLFYQCTMALPLDMRAHGIGARAYGVLIALNGAIIVVLQPLASRALERFARPHVLAAGALLTGLGMGLTALAHSAEGYAGCIALWTLGEIALAPVGSAV